MLLASSSEYQISVIVPVHNGGAAFWKCCLSLKNANPAPAEVIVVVDGGMDDSWQIANQFGFTVVRTLENQGPARARNLGASVAKGSILFFVDADVEIAPDAIAHIRQLFHQFPHTAAIIGSYDDAPGQPNFLSQYKNLFHHYTHQHASENASTFWGACGAIRQEAFWAVGGFDRRYRRPCVEDIDLGYRLKRSGYQIQLCKSLQVKHLKHWGVLSLLQADFCYRALPWTMLILRDKALNNDLNLGIVSRISVVLVYVVLLLGGLSPWYPVIQFFLLPLLLGLFILNAPIYRFFQHKRGTVFAIKVVPMHWLYYFYSGLGFALGCCHHGLKQLAKQKMNSAFMPSKPV